jgi:hypothetical protein
MYLIGSGNVDEGLMQARQLFTRIRTVTNSSSVETETTEQIDEGIELIHLGSQLHPHRASRKH